MRRASSIGKHEVLPEVNQNRPFFRNISTGLRPLGFLPQVGVDVNPYMCAALKANGYPNVIEGDVTDPLIRLRLHLAPEVFRGTLCAGFPCQPLSAQGDQRGEDDPRARPFRGVLHTMWEQQHGALVLECVPQAKVAPWVQRQLQQLAWSMGMHGCTLNSKSFHWIEVGHAGELAGGSLWYQKHISYSPCSTCHWMRTCSAWNSSFPGGLLGLNRRWRSSMCRPRTSQSSRMSSMAMIFDGYSNKSRVLVSCIAIRLAFQHVLVAVAHLISLHGRPIAISRTSRLLHH